MSEIKTAEEYVLRELENEKALNKELNLKVREVLNEATFYMLLLKQICKNIIIKDSAYFGRYFDFEYQIAEGDNRNAELFNVVVDFMKENGIIKDEVQEEKSDG